MPNYWQHHGWQHTRLLCPSPSPSFTISQSLVKLMSIESMMPSNHLILYCPLLFLPSIFPRIRVFTNKSPKDWSFSLRISAPNEYSVLISLELTGLISWMFKTQEPCPAPQLETISSLVLSLIYGPTLTSVHGCLENNTFDYMDICCQSDVSDF